LTSDLKGRDASGEKKTLDTGERKEAGKGPEKRPTFRIFRGNEGSGLTGGEINRGKNQMRTFARVHQRKGGGGRKTGIAS